MAKLINKSVNISSYLVYQVAPNSNQRLQTITIFFPYSTPFYPLFGFGFTIVEIRSFKIAGTSSICHSVSCGRILTNVFYGPVMPAAQ